MGSEGWLDLGRRQAARLLRSQWIFFKVSSTLPPVCSAVRQGQDSHCKHEMSILAGPTLHFHAVRVDLACACNKAALDGALSACHPHKLSPGNSLGA
jgi:hypothetical protein